MTEDPYVKHLSQDAETFRALADLVEPQAETEKKKAMVQVARGLAEVCEMMAEYRIKELEITEREVQAS